jgi:hypothetical protein
MNKKFLLVVSVLLLTGCGKSNEDKLVEYKIMYCEIRTNKCIHDETIKVKVKKFDNTVYFNVFEKNGTPSGNYFLENCQVFNKSNWKCNSHSMVEGDLILSDSSKLQWSKEGKHYISFEKTKK